MRPYTRAELRELFGIEAEQWAYAAASIAGMGVEPTDEAVAVAIGAVISAALDLPVVRPPAEISVGRHGLDVTIRGGGWRAG